MFPVWADWTEGGGRGSTAGRPAPPRGKVDRTLPASAGVPASRPARRRVIPAGHARRRHVRDCGIHSGSPHAVTAVTGCLGTGASPSQTLALRVVDRVANPRKHGSCVGHGCFRSDTHRQPACAGSHALCQGRPAQSTSRNILMDMGLSLRSVCRSGFVALRFGNMAVVKTQHGGFLMTTSKTRCRSAARPRTATP